MTGQPALVSPAGDGKYRYKGYLMERIHSPGKGWWWMVTNHDGRRLRNFRTLREARAFVADDPS